MALWTHPPKTWVAAETVGATLQNQEVRDQLLSVIPVLETFAFSSGEGNDAGGGDTQLSGYDVSIPAEIVLNDGNAILVEGNFTLAANTNTKTAKLQVGSGPAVTIVSTAVNVAGHIVPFRVTIRRRSSTTAVMVGNALQGAGTGGAPTNYLTAASWGTVAWSSVQTLKIYAASSAADDIKLQDYHVTILQGAGTLV